MGQPKSSFAYPQARALLDKALFAPNGIAVNDIPFNKASSLRFSMYALRKKEREDSINFFEKGDPMYGKSAWEELQISINDPDESGPPDRPVTLLILKADFALDNLTITDPLSGEKI